MIVFYVMLAGILAARLIGASGFDYLNDWEAAARIGLSVMFVFTGTAHFNRMRPDLIAMVPPRLPNPSGLAELAGAMGLLMPPLARLAAYGLVLLLVAVFPANIHAARTNHTIAVRPSAYAVHPQITPSIIMDRPFAVVD